MDLVDEERSLMLDDTCAMFHASDIPAISRLYPPLSKGVASSERIYSLNDAFPPLWEVSFGRAIISVSNIRYISAINRRSIG